MTKENYTLTPSLDQGTPPVYHQGIRINDPEFNFEDAVLSRLEKIQVVTDSMLFQIDSGMDFSLDGHYGAHAILDESCKELRSICKKIFHPDERGTND